MFLRPGWETQRDRRYVNQMASLGPSYFARGEQRLKGLKAWARGAPPASA